MVTMSNYDARSPYCDLLETNSTYCPSWPEIERWALGYSRSERTTDIDRPQGRRVKPLDLLGNPTPLGYRQQAIANHRYLFHERYQLLSCNGAPFTRYSRYQVYYLMDESSPECAEPNVAVQLRNMIKSTRVNLAESVGEWKDTADAVNGAAGALKQAYRDLRYILRQPRRRWPSELQRWWRIRGPEMGLHRPRVSDVPAAYVATQYGILPWITLANDSIDALNARGQDLSMRKLYRASKTNRQTTRTAGQKGGTLVRHIEVSNKSIAVVTYSKHIGTFTTGNLLEAIWAGVPVSFMVDWFLGVGQWLSAIDALDGVTSITGTTTIRTKVHNRDTRLVEWATGYKPRISRIGTYTKRSYYRKGLNISLPWHPQWNPSVSWGKLASSIALLLELKRQ